MMERCVNCSQPIQAINYVLGEQWMHVDHPYAAFPTERKGTAWRYCKLSVAQPVKVKSGVR